MIVENPVISSIGIFELCVVILQSSFMAIKIVMTNRHTENAIDANKYPGRIGFHQGIHALLLLLPFLWFFDILIVGPLHILQLTLPAWLRWIAVVDYILVILIMIWQMRVLSTNISADHEMRYLVTDGPYQFVRHPLYLLFIVMQLDMFLITGNLIFVIAFIPAVIASKIRADFEEELLIEEYGEEYKKYKNITGQLFPKL